MGCHVEDKSDANPQHKQLKCVTNTNAHADTHAAETDTNTDTNTNTHANANANANRGHHVRSGGAAINPDASERPG